MDAEGHRIPGRESALPGAGGPGMLYPAAARVVLGNSTHGRSAPECGLDKASPSVGEERRGGRQPSQEARAQEEEARAQKGPVGQARGRLPLWLAPWLMWPLVPPS